MSQHEYRRLCVDERTFDVTINEWGAEGWKIINSGVIDNGNWWAIFKRDIPYKHRVVIRVDNGRA